MNNNQSELKDLLYNNAVRGQLGVIRNQLLVLDDPDDIGVYALWGAIYGGHLDIVQWLLENDEKSKWRANPSKKNSEGLTALLIAAEQGHFAVVRWLLENGFSNSWERDPRGYTALLIAAERGHLTIQKWFLTNLRLKKEEEGTEALFYYAQLGDVKRVEWLIEQGWVVCSRQDNKGRTALLHGALNKRLAIVQLFIERGWADSAQRDRDGQTALLCAAQAGDLAIVQWLFALDRYNKRQEADSKGWTALVYAADNNHVNIVSWLLQEGFTNYDKNTLKRVVKSAATKGHYEVLKWLVEHSWIGLSFQQKSFKLAAKYGHLELLKYLVIYVNDKKIPIYRLEQRGIRDSSVLLRYAVERGHVDIVHWLLSNDSHQYWENNETKKDNAYLGLRRCVEIGNCLEILSYFLACGENDFLEYQEQGDTILLHAVKKGRLEEMQYLLRYALDKKIPYNLLKQSDNIGNTALLCAIKWGHVKIVEWLLSNYSVQYWGGEENRKWEIYRGLWRCIELGRRFNLLECFLNYDKKNCLEHKQNGDTILLYAVKQGRLKEVQQFLRYAFSERLQLNLLGQQDISGNTALLCAVERGHAEIVEWLLDTKQQQYWLYKNETNDEIYTGLQKCIKLEKHFKILELLLNYDAKYFFEWQQIEDTILLYAVKQGCLKALQFLFKYAIEKQVSIDLLGRQNDTDKNIFLCAVKYQHVKIIEWLLSEDCSYWGKPEKYQELWRYVALEDNLKAIKILLRYGKEDFLNKKGENGDTILFHAVKHDRLDVSQYLLSYADKQFGLNLLLKQRDLQGKSILACAVKGNCQNIVDWLLTKECPYWDRSEIYQELLRYVQLGGDLEAIKILLRYGKKDFLYKKTGKQDTILFYAAKNNRLDVLEYLLEYANKFFQINFLNLLDRKNRNIFIYAAENNYQEIVKWLLNSNFLNDIEKIQQVRKSLLICVTLRDNLATVKYLLDYKIDQFKLLETKDAKKRTLLLLAAEYGCLEIINELLARDKTQNSLNKRDNQGRTALLCSASNGHLDVVKKLVNNNKECILEKDKQGLTALLYAVKNNHLIVIKWLFNKKEINWGKNWLEQKIFFAKDNDGNNALLLAIIYNRLKIINWLLLNTSCKLCNFYKWGFEPICDRNKNTALILAASYGHLEIIKQVLENEKFSLGISLLEKNNQGNNVISIAADNGHLDIMQYLLDYHKKEEERYSKNHNIKLPNPFEIMNNCGPNPNPLLLAANNGHLEVVAWLLEIKMEPNLSKANRLMIKDEHGNTALLLAISNGHFELVKYLLESGAKFLDQNCLGQNALLVAAITGQIKILKELLNKGAKLTVVDNEGNNALLLSASRGHFSTVKYLSHRVDIFHQNYKKQNAILFSLLSNKPNITAFLLQNMLKIKKNKNNIVSLIPSLFKILEKNPDKYNILLCSAHWGYLDVIKLFITNGYKLSEVDEKNNTVLLCAVSRGNLDIVKWLLENHHASRAEINDLGQTALLLASSRGYLHIVQWLFLTKEKDSLEMDHEGRDVLLCASAFGHFNIIKWLLKNNKIDLSRMLKQDKNQINSFLYLDKIKDKAGAKCKWLLKQKDKFDRTLLMIAASKGDIKTIKYVLKYKEAKVSEKNSAGWTPLLYAAFFGNITTFEMLLKYQANILDKTHQGQTVLMCAFLGGRAAMVRYLLSKNLNALEQDNEGHSILLYAASLFPSSICESINQWLLSEGCAILKQLDEISYQHDYRISKMKYFKILEFLILNQDKYFFPLLNKIDLKYELSLIQKLLYEFLKENKNILLHSLKQKIDFIIYEITCFKKPKKLKGFSDKDRKIFEKNLKKLYSKENELSNPVFFYYLDDPETLDQKLKTFSKVILTNLQENGEWGEISGNELYGGHTVISCENIHFKHNPYAPPVEFMVNYLNELILEQGSPPVTIVKLKGESSDKSRVFLASSTVAGQNLQYILSYRPEYISKIDPQNFSKMIVSSLLVNPQDGKPDNYMVQFSSERCNIKSIKLTCIDNDMAFVEPIIDRCIRNEKVPQHYPNVRNVLYFFPDMSKPVDKKFKTEFLNQSPEEKLLEWLLKLSNQNKKYNELYKQGVFDDKDNNLGFPIQLKKGTVTELYRKLKIIQQLFKSENNVTHETLFYTLNKSLSIYYEYTSKRAWLHLGGRPNDPENALIAKYIQTAIQLLYEDSAPSFEDLKNITSSTVKSLHMSSIALKCSKNTYNQDNMRSVAEAMSELISLLDFSQLERTQGVWIQKIISVLPLNEICSLTLRNMDSFNYQTLKQLHENHKFLPLELCLIGNTSIQELNKKDKFQIKRFKEKGGKIYLEKSHEYKKIIKKYNHQNIQENFSICLPIRPKLKRILSSSSDHINYVKLAAACYQNDGGKIPTGWEIKNIFNDTSNTGYFGVMYLNQSQKKIIIASRGTNVGEPIAAHKDLNDDMNGILLNNVILRQIIAVEFVLNSIRRFMEEYPEDYLNYQYGLTGHSLGGWLTQIALYHLTDIYLDSCNSNSDHIFPEVRAIVFDSPGARDMLKKLQSNIPSARRFNIDHLNVINYVSSPNVINTCHRHIGLLYRVYVDLSGITNPMNWVHINITNLRPQICSDFVNYNMKSHSIENIEAAFDPETGIPRKYKLVRDWPRMKLKQHNVSFKELLLGWFVSHTTQSLWRLVRNSVKILLHRLPIQLSDKYKNIYNNTKCLLQGTGEILYGLKCIALNHTLDQEELKFYSYLASLDLDGSFDPNPSNSTDTYLLHARAHYQVTDVPNNRLNMLVLGHRLSLSLRDCMRFPVSLLNSTRLLPLELQEILRRCRYEKKHQQRYLVFKNSDSILTPLTPESLELQLREIWHDLECQQKFRAEIETTLQEESSHGYQLSYRTLKETLKQQLTVQLISDFKKNFNRYTRLEHSYYAQLALACYEKDGGLSSNLLPPNWTIGCMFDDHNTGYFGIVYVNHELQEIIIASRGTANLKDIFADLNGIVLGDIVEHQTQIVTFVLKTIAEYIKQYSEYRYSLTGHSLGGWLSQIALYHAAVKRLHSIDSNDLIVFPVVRAIVFDSPGASEMLEKLHNLSRNQIDIYSLNIINYVSNPNPINMCNHHVGLLYRVYVQVKDITNLTDISKVMAYILESHSIENIKNVFDSDTGFPKKYKLVKDWPCLKPHLEDTTSVNKLGLINALLTSNLDPKELEIYMHLANAEDDFDLTNLNNIDIYQATYQGHYRVEEVARDRINMLVFEDELYSILRKCLKFYRELLAINSIKPVLPKGWVWLLQCCRYEKVGNQRYLVTENFNQLNLKERSPMFLESLIRQIFSEKAIKKCYHNLQAGGHVAIEPLLYYLGNYVKRFKQLFLGQRKTIDFPVVQAKLAAPFVFGNMINQAPQLLLWNLPDSSTVQGQVDAYLSEGDQNMGCNQYHKALECYKQGNDLLERHSISEDSNLQRLKKTLSGRVSGVEDILKQNTLQSLTNLG